MLRSFMLVLLVTLAGKLTLAADPIYYESAVRPILKAHCFQCHGEEEKHEAQLDLRLVRTMTSGGESGAALVAGKSANSLLWQRIAQDEMPPGKKKLSATERRTVEQWIAQGAKTITVWDSQSPPMRRSATVLPPTGCGNAGGKDPTIIQIEKRLVGYVPPGRRAILYWENEASNIDIIVEKEGGAKIKGGQNDRDWGEWYRDKSKWMGRRSTEEGVKLYAIGTYKVFAKNKTGPSGPDTQKVKLALTNSIGARESVENDFQISKDGGEVWLADIRITDQGINIIKINNDIKK